MDGVIRPLAAADLPALAAALPEAPLPKGRLAACLAAVDGRPVGWGALCSELHGQPLAPGRRHLELHVAPGSRRRGIGRRLVAALLAAAPGTRVLSAAVAADDLTAQRFAAQIGFRPEYQMLACTLDLPGYDLQPWLPAVPRTAAATGLAFSTLAAAADRKATARELWELDHRLSADVPEWSGVVVPFARYCAENLSGPGFDPAGVLLAYGGGRAVGMAATACDGDGGGYTWFTGVERAWRGRGVARALKVLTIAWAQAAGLTRLTCHNNSSSAGIVGLNRRLGYRIDPGSLYLLRELAPPSDRQEVEP